MVTSIQIETSIIRASYFDDINDNVYIPAFLMDNYSNKDANLTSPDGYASLLSPSGDIVVGVHLICVVFLSLSGNVLIMVIFLKNWRSFKPIDKLIVNISVSDILTAIFGYPLPLLSSFRHRWDFGNAGCVWYSALAFTGATVSMCSIAFVAFFRYVKISQHTSVYQNSFNMKVNFAVIFSWVYALFWTTLPLYGWGSYHLEPFKISCTIDWASRSAKEQSYVMTVLVTTYALPLGAMVCCYLSIARRLYRHQLHIRRRGHRTTSTLMQFRNENRLILTAFISTLCFVISWTPYAIISFIIFISGNREISMAGAAVPAFFSKTSTLYNPIIYMICNRKFRNDAVRLVCRCGCKMYDLTINVKESFYDGHSNGMRIILNGRKITHRVVRAHPMLRHLNRKDSNELIPMTQRHPKNYDVKSQDPGRQDNRVHLKTVSGNLASAKPSSLPTSERTFEKSTRRYTVSPAWHAGACFLPNEVLPGPSTSSGRRVTHTAGFLHRTEMLKPKRDDLRSPSKRVVQVSIASAPQVFTSHKS